MNIVDVARYAGVSKSTVSRVLNEKDNVNEETRLRVQKAMEHLGYMPNIAARTLSLKKTDCIGIVVERLYDPFFCDLIKGAEDGANQCGFNLIFCDAHGEEKKKGYINYLAQGKVDGIIIYGSYLTDEKVVKQLVSSGFPFLLIENSFEDMDVNSILINNTQGAYNAVQYLIGLGHRNIAHITGNMNRKVSLDRLNGYVTAMQQHGISIPNQYIAYNFSADKYKAGVQRMEEYLALRQIPTAVFCADYETAYGAMHAAEQAGLKVPRDLSVIGFDEPRYFEKRFTGPELSTVKQPLHNIGKESVVLLADIIEGKAVTPVKKFFDTELLIKESCDVFQADISSPR